LDDDIYLVTFDFTYAMEGCIDFLIFDISKPLEATYIHVIIRNVLNNFNSWVSESRGDIIYYLKFEP
jgi:hypothetical protein